jgi:hypothetical protein
MFVLRIRPEQLEAFRAAAEEDFRRRLLESVRRRFPRQCARLGVPGTAAFLERGIAEARRQRFTTERDMAAFIDVLLIAGEDCPEQPWAREALGSGDPAPGDAAIRLERFRIAAVHVLREGRQP